MMIVDAHQHFWDPARGGYDWFDDEGPALRRPYLPQHLAPLMAQSGVTKTVLVQADGTLAETDYILDLAEETDFVGAVVGWVDFDDPKAIGDLRRLANRAKLRGLRPIIQGQSDTDWMLWPSHDWAYKAICDHGLSFDALGKPRHLANFATLAKRWPDMPIVLDHALKPEIANQTATSFQVWQDGMSRLAEAQNICCKISGLLTEAGPGAGPAQLRPYVDHLLTVFGASRLMWGSNWPVDGLIGDYATLLATTSTLIAHLPSADRAEILGGTASRFYRL